MTNWFKSCPREEKKWIFVTDIHVTHWAHRIQPVKTLEVLLKSWNYHALVKTRLQSYYYMSDNALDQLWFVYNFVMKFCLWPFCFLCFLSYEVVTPHGMCMARTQCDIHVLNTLMFSLSDGVENTHQKWIWKLPFFHLSCGMAHNPFWKFTVHKLWKIYFLLVPVEGT